MARASASFLVGTALAAGVLAAIAFARSQAGMAVSVQVLDGCTVGSATPSVTDCQVRPDRTISAPSRGHGVPVSSDPRGAAAGSEERTNDGFTTFFF